MRRVSAWFDARSVPFIVTMVLAAAGSAYSLLWASLAHKGWHAYSDLWNSAGIALSIGHGHFAAAYAPSSQLDSPPGFEFLLAPVMVLGHALGLGTTMAQGSSYNTFGLLIVAVASVMGGTVLFALDAVARFWEFSEGKRLALSAFAGLGVVSAAAVWGHPEDCIALACVLWAALAMERRGTVGAAQAGWLLGVAVACQPLALLGVAPVVAHLSWRDLRAVAWRLALPTLVVFVPPLVAAPSRALHAVVDQPFFPPAESSTPFSHLARALGHGMYSGGTLRLGATVAAVLVGWVACRRRHDLPAVLLVMALAFALRVVFESELLGFYFFPVVALALLLSLRTGWTRFEACAALSVACLVLGDRRQHAIELWWPAMMALTAAMLVLAAGAVARRGPDGWEASTRTRATREERQEVRSTISHVRLLDG
jgi:hypothetical protein